MKQMTPILEAPEPSMEKWQVCVDGACRVEGSEIGIVLQGQIDTKLRYAAKLTFNATNNTTEYETMIMELKTIKKVSIQNSTIYSDSQLVFNQCPSHFKVWDPSLLKYEEKVQSLLAEIREKLGDCELRQVARGDNSEAELLVKMAAVGEQYLTHPLTFEV